MIRLAIAVACAAAIVSPMPAIACSVIESYKVPTSIELAERADSIVLARVGDAIEGDGGEPFGDLELLPELLVSGTVMPGTLRIEGYHGNGVHVAHASDPDDLRDANPDAFTGGCNRYVFAKGMLLLLFLEQDDDGAFRIINAPFARTLEDVPDADAPWVRAVRLYDAVADLPRAARRARLTAERARLLATGDRIDRIVADDIQRQLRGRRTTNHD